MPLSPQSTELAPAFSSGSAFVRACAAMAGISVVLLPTILLCLPLLPWRRNRVQLGNIAGGLVSRWVMWCFNMHYELVGPHPGEFAPALFVQNHTGTIDFWLALQLSPTPSSGTAKRSLIWVPFVGVAYWLSGHLMLDRGNSASAIAAMKSMTEFVHSSGISIWILPEGTRSESGRLLPFKKGFVHIALGTQLPIVPVVVHDGHLLWGKGWPIRPGTVRIEVQPAISTEHWSRETMHEHVAELEAVFRERLGPHQQPVSQ